MYDNNLPYGEQLRGKIITIINRSEVVGRPLAALLANDGAKVYSVDINDILIFDRGPNLELAKYKVQECEEKLEEILGKSDVVITGVPNPNYRVPIDALKGLSCLKMNRKRNYFPLLFEINTKLIDQLIFFYFFHHPLLPISALRPV